MNYNHVSVNKRIDLNRLFLNLGIFYGPFDGQQVVYRLSSHLYCQFLLCYIFFYILKFGSLLFIGKHDLMSFIVADYFNNEKGNIHKLMTLVTIAYCCWTFCLLWTYQRVNVHKRDAYWLSMLPFDQSKFHKSFDGKKLIGMSEEQFAFIQHLYHKFARLSFKVIMTSIILMEISTGVIYFSAFFQRYGNKSYFFPVFVGNTVLLYFMMFLAYFLTLGMSLNYTFLAILIKHRFRHIYSSLNAIVNNPKKDLHAISFQLLQFNKVVVEMLKINHFWSKTFGINFFMAMVIIFLLAQQIIYGEELIFRFFFIFLTAFIYSSCIVFPLYSASLVHSAVC